MSLAPPDQDDLTNPTADETPPEPPTPPLERRLIIVGGLVLLLYAGGLVGLALLPTLSVNHPLLLMFLHPISATLYLIAPHFSLPFFVTVATLRRFVVHCLYYLLGEWYGDFALHWTAKNLGGSPRIVALIEQFFGRFDWLIVLLFPGPFPSIFAGTTRMPRLRFVALDLLGTAAAITVIHLAAQATAGPLAQTLRFIERNSQTLTIITVLATVIWAVWRSKRSA